MIEYLKLGESPMPSVGLGLWKVSPEDAPSMVHSSIDAGYRHLDSACDYGNEAAVGVGIHRRWRTDCVAARICG